MLYNALSMQKKTPKLPIPLGFHTLPEEDRATAISNMHKKFDKNHTCHSRDIIADRQKNTQTYSSQYYATALAGELIISNNSRNCNVQ